MAASQPPGSNPDDPAQKPPDGSTDDFKWKGVEKGIVKRTTGLTSNREGKPERRKRQRLGEMLIQAALLTDDQLEMGLAEQRRTRGLIGEALVGMGFVSEAAVAEAISAQTGVPYLDVKLEPVPVALLKMVSEEMCRKNRLVPLSVDGIVLRLVMANPFDVVALDQIRTNTGLIPFPSIGAWGAISKAIEYHFVTLEAHGDGFEELIAAAEARAEDMTATEMSEGGPLLDLVDKLIVHAIDEKATDIHIEPEREIVRTRYRIDSMLHPGPTLPKKLQVAISARCKVMAGLNLAESRVPQDGRIRFMHKDRRIDLRVATYLCNFGENIELRVLDKTNTVLALDRLGFFDDDYARFLKLLDKPHGIILATGPTGCGKTTTLYAAIAQMNSIEVNIMTIEDPIEYDLSLVRQSQVNYKAGVTFATGLRALLRQDPDIILIGEMRDTETAQLAVRAAMTGHLVFSTLHTNTAVGSLNRMVDMGVEPILLADALLGCIGQRLARTLCIHCRESVPCPPHRVAEIQEIADREQMPWDGQVAKAVGCDECKGRGYKGRAAVYEMFRMSHATQKLVVERNFGELATVARREGMRSLFEDAVRRVITKSLALEEMDRVIERGHEMDIEDVPFVPTPPEGEAGAEDGAVAVAE